MVPTSLVFCSVPSSSTRPWAWPGLSECKNCISHERLWCFTTIAYHLFIKAAARLMLAHIWNLQKHHLHPAGEGPPRLPWALGGAAAGWEACSPSTGTQPSALGSTTTWRVACVFPRFLFMLLLLTDRVRTQCVKRVLTITWICMSHKWSYFAILSLQFPFALPLSHPWGYKCVQCHRTTLGDPPPWMAPPPSGGLGWLPRPQDAAVSSGRPPQDALRSIARRWATHGKFSSSHTRGAGGVFSVILSCSVLSALRTAQHLQNKHFLGNY